MQSPKVQPSNNGLELAVDELAQSSIDALRQKYSELFLTLPPAAFGPDLLRRSIAQRLQEDEFGKLSAPTQRELDRLVSLMAGTPTGRIELGRRIKPGSILVRDWKDKSHRVTVIEHGFGYNGKTYKNLSEIARLITGTQWNGPRFFGLRAGAL